MKIKKFRGFTPLLANDVYGGEVMTGIKKSLQRFEVTFLAEEKNVTLEVAAYDKEGLFEVLGERINYVLSEIDNLKVRRKHHNEK